VITASLDGSPSAVLTGTGCKIPVSQLLSMSSTLEALIHELSVALGQGPGCKPEGGHGPFPAVMTAQPFADRDPDALTEGDPHELGKCGDVLCSNLKEDHLSKDQQGDTMTSGNEPLRSSEARNGSRKIILVDRCRRVDLFDGCALGKTHH